MISRSGNPRGGSMEEEGEGHQRRHFFENPTRKHGGESNGNPRRNKGWDISRDIFRESEGKHKENMRT